MYIGIDLGTSSVKLLLLDGDGRIKKIVSREYPLLLPQPGWSEQDPKEWIRATSDGMKELLAETDKAQVRAIGAGGQMHGLVVLDKDDRILRPAILWNDGRTQAETDRLNNDIGMERLSAYTGNIAFAGFTAPKLMWMKTHEPELFARIDKVMLPKDYLNYVLTGVHASDYSDASGMLLLDVAHKRWSKEMLDIVSLREAQMPALFDSTEVIGTLTEKAADLFGLHTGVKVIAGAGDNAAAAIGTGTVSEGDCNISVGTSGTVFIPCGTFRAAPDKALHAFCHADGAFHLMGVILSAGSCNKWWMEEILHTSDFDAETKALSTDALGHNHVYYHPYLMGERAPHNDAYARASFIGMSMDTTRADMTLAMMEGVAFAIRESLEAARALGITVSHSMLSGGGAKNDLWKRIFANVCDLEITIPETEQGPGYGAAIMAAVADGAFTDIREAVQKLIRITETITPDKETVARYDARFHTYREIYPALAHIYRKL